MKYRIKTLLLFLTFSIAVFGQIDVAKVELNDSTTLILLREKFVLKEQKIEYNDEKESLEINGETIFGTDGDVPQFKLTCAIFKVGNRTIELETSRMYNPWFGNSPDEKIFKLTIDQKGLRLKGIFSDGAGTYLSEWVITGNIGERVMLTTDEAIIIESFYSD